jgi:hypothetical protein
LCNTNLVYRVQNQTNFFPRKKFIIWFWFLFHCWSYLFKGPNLQVKKFKPKILLYFHHVHFVQQLQNSPLHNHKSIITAKKWQSWPSFNSTSEHFLRHSAKITLYHSKMNRRLKIFFAERLRMGCLSKILCFCLRNNMQDKAASH